MLEGYCRLTFLDLSSIEIFNRKVLSFNHKSSQNSEMQIEIAATARNIVVLNQPRDVVVDDELLFWN